jgi:hypothetical protein
MATSTPYLQGRHLTAVTVRGYSREADGTLTLGLTRNVQALISEHDLQSTPAKENISPVTLGEANNLVTENDSSLSMRVLLLASGENPLAVLWALYDFYLIEWTRGGQAWQYWGTRGQFGETINSKGGNFQTMGWDQFYPGSAPIVYSG